MTYSVIWEPTSIGLATKFLADDPDGLRDVFQAVDHLADLPRPSAAFAMGRSGMFRLRVGRYRVVFEVDDAGEAIKGASPRSWVVETARATGSRCISLGWVTSQNRRLRGAVRGTKPRRRVGSLRLELTGAVLRVDP